MLSALRKVLFLSSTSQCHKENVLFQFCSLGQLFSDRVQHVASLSPRILALEKLGAVFNQVAFPLQYTPRKFVIHPESNNLIIIETDHNAYTEATKAQRKQQMAEVIGVGDRYAHLFPRGVLCSWKCSLLISSQLPLPARLSAGARRGVEIYLKTQVSAQCTISQCSFLCALLRHILRTTLVQDSPACVTPFCGDSVVG